MSILITGGTGFIGAEIARMLHERGEGPIHVAYRSGNFDRLGELRDEVSLVELDLGDTDAITRVVETTRPNKIFHFGAMLTGPGEADPQALLRVNADGLMHLYEQARLNDVEQLIFASSIGTYGRDLGPGPITDLSLQRPHTVYGVTKVFAENLGAYYRSKYGLDYRGIRYPSLVGPGVTTPSVAQYTSWMIEHAIRGESFNVWVDPSATIALLYYKDAARAALDLADAPSSGIQAINYLVDGVTPTPNAGELADAVRAKIPGADITFEPDDRYPGALREAVLIDDSTARHEWGWEPAFGLDEMIDDFIAELA